MYVYTYMFFLFLRFVCPFTCALLARNLHTYIPHIQPYTCRDRSASPIYPDMVLDCVEVLLKYDTPDISRRSSASSTDFSPAVVHPK